MNIYSHKDTVKVKYRKVSKTLESVTWPVIFNFRAPAVIDPENEAGQQKAADVGNLNFKRWLQLFVPLPLVGEVVPVPLRLLHGKASTLNTALGYRQGFVHQAQTPRRNWPALDGVCSKKGRCYGTQEPSGVRMGHSACFHSNHHQ